MRLFAATAYMVLSLTFATAGCGENAVPEWPTYARDIKPLMEARCIRCHGAGGKLNNDPDHGGLILGPPTQGDFTTLEDVGKTRGLLYYTSAGKGGVAAMKVGLNLVMPPPPSDPLTDRETTILLDWANTPL